jgi:hypothetical protein
MRSFRRRHGKRPNCGRGREATHATSTASRPSGSDFGLYLCGGWTRRLRHSRVCLAMVRLLLLGASGVVGRAVLQLALEHQGVAAVIAPTRNVLPSHGNLSNPVTAELESLLPQAIEWTFPLCLLGRPGRAARGRSHWYRPSVLLHPPDFFIRGPRGKRRRTFRAWALSP